MMEGFLKGGKPFSKGNELETRLVFVGIEPERTLSILNSRGFVFDEFRTAKRVTEDQVTLDIYNSSRYRVKRALKYYVHVHAELYPLCFYLNEETAEKSVAEIHEEPELIESLFNFCFYKILAATHTILRVSRFISAKMIELHNGVFNLSVELDFDPSVVTDPKTICDELDLFVEISNHLIVAMEYSAVKYLRYRKPKIKLQPMPTDVEAPFRVSPKWNGVRHQFVVRSPNIIFKAIGFEKSLVYSRKREIKILKRLYPLAALFLEQVGLEVEVMETFSVCYSVNLSTKMSTGLRVVRELKRLFHLVRSVLDTIIYPQVFYWSCNMRSFLDFPPSDLRESVYQYTDGLIITKGDSQFKVKPLPFVTIDLLLNEEQHLVTAEGIRLGKSVVWPPDVQKVVGLVYECRPLFGSSIHKFVRVVQRQKMILFNSLVVNVLKQRRDRGHRANTWKTIVSYVQGMDLVDLSIKYKKCLKS